MNEQQRENCRILAQFLMELPPERLRMKHWVGPEWKGAKDFSCGTTACAAGWATTIPHFQKQGMYMDKHGYLMIRKNLILTDLFGQAAHIFYNGQHRSPMAVALSLLSYADIYADYGDR